MGDPQGGGGDDHPRPEEDLLQKDPHAELPEGDSTPLTIKEWQVGRVPRSVRRGCRPVLRDSGTTALPELREVDRVETAGSHVRIQAGEKTHLVHDTLPALESRLSAESFLRPSRSALVNRRGFDRFGRGPPARAWSCWRGGKCSIPSRRIGRTIREAIPILWCRSAGEEPARSAAAKRAARIGRCAG
jgi:hypothetical protein